MIDRRIVVALLAVVLVGFAAHAATSGTAAPATGTAPDDGIRPATPITGAVPGTVPVDSDPAVRPPIETSAPPQRATPTPTPVSVSVSVSSTTVDTANLVEARRPTIEATEPAGEPHDHSHDDDGAHDPNGDRSEASIEEIAAMVVVAGWTWRFDDLETRQATAMAPVAGRSVIDTLAPSTDELQRRFEDGEVSWVIISEIAVDSERATVVFDHHVVASNAADTVTARAVVVTVADGVVIEVVS